MSDDIESYIHSIGYIVADDIHICNKSHRCIYKDIYEDTYNEPCCHFEPHKYNRTCFLTTCSTIIDGLNRTCIRIVKDKTINIKKNTGERMKRLIDT